MGIVVDDSMDIGLGAIEQLDNGDINVPQLVGLGGADTDGGFGRMNAQAWPSPTSFAHHAAPSCGGGKYLADALCVPCQCA